MWLVARMHRMAVHLRVDARRMEHHVLLTEDLLGRFHRVHSPKDRAGGTADEITGEALVGRHGYLPSSLGLSEAGSVFLSSPFFLK